MIPKGAEGAQVKAADNDEVELVDVISENNKTKDQRPRKVTKVFFEDEREEFLASLTPNKKQTVHVLVPLDRLMIGNRGGQKQTSRCRCRWHRAYKGLIMALFLPLIFSLAILFYKSHKHAKIIPESTVVDITLACEPRALAFGQFEGVTMVYDHHSMNTVVQANLPTRVECINIGQFGKNDTCYVQVLKFHTLKFNEHVQVLEDGSKITHTSRVCVENFRAYTYACARKGSTSKKFVYTTVISHDHLESSSPGRD